MSRLSNRIAIITGAAQGIGLATAQRFVAEGATVVLCDLNAQALQAAVQHCHTRPMGRQDGDAWSVELDVTQRDSVNRMVDAVMQRHGRIDVLVNNAGITADARLQQMSEAQFDRVIDVNLRGVFHCAQAVAPIMVNQGSGVVLNASSVVGLYGNFGQTNYAASKFGVIGMTKTWSRELGPKGVRVNAVAPGFIATPMLQTVPDKVVAEVAQRVPLRRLGRPEEVASVYAFLASDDASYINGAVIEVCGGLTI